MSGRVMEKPRIAVLGAGAWGTALALHLSRAGAPVSLWVYESDTAARVAASRENTDFLPGHRLPPDIDVSGDMEHVLTGANRVLLVSPSQHCRTTLRRAARHLPSEAVLVLAAKGIEKGTLALMTDVAREEAPGHPTAVLSGPSFAQEVARGDPTAIVIASTDTDLAATLQREISQGALRLYRTDDPVGVQLAGSLKNVFAIAAGVITGLGLGHNTVAALITRAISEMRRLGSAAGGRPETFDGLAGVGDLVLTCTGALSRNRRLGEELGTGRRLEEILAGSLQVVEGVETSISARDLAYRHRVEMPIVEQVHAVLHEGKAPRRAIEELLARPLKEEREA